MTFFGAPAVAWIGDCSTGTIRTALALIFFVLLFLPNLHAILSKGQFSLCWDGCTCIVCQTLRERERRASSR
jgi:hypothetical protein